MVEIESVGSALAMTLGMLAISITVVAGLMWWLYRVFKNKDDSKNDNS